VSSPSQELQAAIYNQLATVQLSALVGGRVYENVPEKPEFPYISFGPSDVIPADPDLLTLRTETVQIDCWSRQHGQLSEAKALTDAIRTALHGYSVNLPTHGLLGLSVVLMRVFRDGDGKTVHGLVQVEAVIEEADD
jgi:hypothetical protein